MSDCSFLNSTCASSFKSSGTCSISFSSSIIMLWRIIQASMIFSSKPGAAVGSEHASVGEPEADWHGGRRGRASVGLLGADWHDGRQGRAGES